MINPQQNVFPLTAPVPHESNGRVFVSKYPAGIDLRTWMATQLMAAAMQMPGKSSDRAEIALRHANALIAELNKTAEVAHETT